MEIQQLKGFHAVAKFRNFTVAAKKTQRTQPTISLQIKALEDELGVRLFERLGPKRVSLTAEGKILQELTAQLVQDFQDIPMRFNEARGIYTTSSVRIVTHNSIMIHLLPEVIKKFKHQFPDCKISILNRSRKEIVHLLETGEADVGITSLENIPPTVDYRLIAKFNRILITKKGHALDQRSPLSLEDIAAYPLVLPTVESNTRRVIDQRFQEAGIDYDLSMEVVGRTAIKTYVGLDLGISILSEYYIGEDDKTKLSVRNVSKHFGKAQTGVAIRKGRKLSEPATTLIQLLQEHLKAQAQKHTAP